MPAQVKFGRGSDTIDTIETPWMECRRAAVLVGAAGCRVGRRGEGRRTKGGR